MSAVALESLWKEKLAKEFEKPYMQQLRAFLGAEKRAKKIIYPRGDDIFQAFWHTPFDQVRVVILGQDPYHQPNQAHGLCFSVREGVPIPPSLANIYKELAQDVGIPPASHGCLTAWAKQGVFLLNSVLTVEEAKAGAHQNKGWETFTDKVIQLLNEEKTGLVFILWGSYAQEKGKMIDKQRHCVLTAPHPSPLSSYRGFFGSRPFSKTNAYLLQQGHCPIDWRIV